jgi:hypothetical protein
VHREFIVTRNLKLIQSSIVRCCMRNLLDLLGWGQILPGSVCFLDSIQTSPDESNLKLDVILASLSINVIFLCQYL